MDNDLKYLLELAAMVSIAVLAALWVMRSLGLRVEKLLTKKEWLIVAKLVAGSALWMLFVIKMIYLNLPQELFIYGRF